MDSTKQKSIKIIIINIRTESALTLFSEPRVDLYGMAGDILHGAEQ
jgi:hypothetical protein